MRTGLVCLFWYTTAADFGPSHTHKHTHTDVRTHTHVHVLFMDDRNKAGVYVDEYEDSSICR